MSVVDLHPEELLDKKGRGTLTAAEAERLDAHLARCATCRVEMQLRADFADELDDPMDEDRPSLTALLEGVAAARPKTPRDETPPGVALRDDGRADGREAEKSAPPSRRSRRASKAPAWFLVAAAILAVSAATGATGMGKRVWTRVVSVVTTVDTAPASAPAPEAAAAKHAARATPAPAPLPEAAPVETIPAPEPEAAPVAAPPKPAPRRIAPPPATLASAPSPSDGPEAAALFDGATAARRAGDYARAIALHRDLLARFPRTREAQTSRATVGRLLLDRGDPSGALASFDSYMAAGSGELGEEAMAGRATALERLGRSDDARRAWEALLAAYPSTPYAAHARARVGVGENPGP